MDIQVNKKVKDVIVEEESVTLILEDDTKIKYATEHDQDCCEHVYGDFSSFELYKKDILKKFSSYEVLSKIELARILGDGFLLRFLSKDNDEAVKVFVPCYDFQNGYYSDDLELIITNENTSTRIDISDLVSHHID
jgi:hypothetical protein